MSAALLAHAFLTAEVLPDVAVKDWWTIILCINATSQYESGRLAIPVGSGIEAGGLRRLSFASGAGLSRGREVDNWFCEAYTLWALPRKLCRSW